MLMSYRIDFYLRLNCRILSRSDLANISNFYFHYFLVQTFPIVKAVLSVN